MCIRSIALVITVNMHDHSCTYTGDGTQTVLRVLNVVEPIAWHHIQNMLLNSIPLQVTVMFYSIERDRGLKGVNSCVELSAWLSFVIYYLLAILSVKLFRDKNYGVSLRISESLQIILKVVFACINGEGDGDVRGDEDRKGDGGWGGTAVPQIPLCQLCPGGAPGQTYGCIRSAVGWGCIPPTPPFWHHQLKRQFSRYV